MADAQESATLDFKEDPAQAPGGNGRNSDAKLVDFLLDERVCLANGDAGEAHIMLGVVDKVPDPAAYTGTERDPEWLANKVFNGTKPTLRVEVGAIHLKGTRLVWIRIPAALTVYERTKGQASHRVGTACVPLPDAERRALTAARANPDFTAAPSELSIAELDPIAVTEGRSRRAGHG